MGGGGAFLMDGKGKGREVPTLWLFQAGQLTVGVFLLQNFDRMKLSDRRGRYSKENILLFLSIPLPKKDFPSASPARGFEQQVGRYILLLLVNYLPSLRL